MIGSFFKFLLPSIAVVSLIVYLPVYFIGRYRYGKRPFARHLVQYALIGYALSLLYLTILWYYPYISFSPEWYFLNLKPFVWVNEVYEMGVPKMIRQLLLNIGMFVPLGLLLPIVFPGVRKLWKTGLACLGTTVFIETLQYFMGRSADIDDVIMNLAGGLLGYLLFYAFNRVFTGKDWWQNMLVRRQS